VRDGSSSQTKGIRLDAPARATSRDRDTVEGVPVVVQSLRKVGLEGDLGRTGRMQWGARREVGVTCKASRRKEPTRRCP